MNTDRLYLIFGILIVGVIVGFGLWASANVVIPDDEKEWSNNVTLIVEIGVGIVVTLFVLLFTKVSESKMDQKIQTIYSSVIKEEYKKLSVKIDRIRIVGFQLELIETKMGWLMNVIKIHNKTKNDSSKDSDTVELLKTHFNSIDTNFQTLKKLDYFTGEVFDRKIIDTILHLQTLFQSYQNPAENKIGMEIFEKIKPILAELRIMMEEDLASAEIDMADLILRNKNDK